jgi:hypothetical protein
LLVLVLVLLLLLCVYSQNKLQHGAQQRGLARAEGAVHQQSYWIWL